MRPLLGVFAFLAAPAGIIAGATGIIGIAVACLFCLIVASLDHLP